MGRQGRIFPHRVRPNLDSPAPGETPGAGPGGAVAPAKELISSGAVRPSVFTPARSRGT